MPTPQDELNKAIAHASTDDLVTILYKLKSQDLALLKAEGTPSTQEALNRPELTPFWEDQFNKLRLKRDPGFQFRDPSPQSCADFYCGYILYLASIKVKATDVFKYNHYIKLSIVQFNSFHAHQAVLNTLVLQYRNSTEKEELDTFCAYVTKQYSLLLNFKTPGFLLLANTFYYLATFYQNLGLREESIACYQECWKHLHCAKLLERNSERDIHNAYFGQGLIFSNAFRLSTIDAIKDNFLTVAKEALPAHVRRTIETEAQSTLPTTNRIYDDKNESLSDWNCSDDDERESAASASLHNRSM